MPYIVEGWKNSVDLSTEDEGKLLSEVLRWNQKIIDIHHNNDKQEYLNIFSKKNTQVYKSLYLSDEEIEFENSSIFNANDKNLFALPADLYELQLYSDNKLVSVRIPYELPGFTYEPKIINEDSWGFGLNIYFHRQKIGEQLEIIR